MSGDSIRQLLRKQPFTPIEVHLSSGDVYQISHPEQVLVTGASLYVWFPDSDSENDHVAWCSLLHVTGVEYIDRRSKKKGNKS